jgi:post-segregation antitoxin (ccd killing protein)
MAKKTPRKRGGLGENPLDAMVPVQAASKASKRGLAPAGTSSKKTAKAEPAKVEKARQTLHLPVDLVERAKDTVYWTPGLTLAALAEAGLRAEVERHEKKNGGPFKPRGQKLVGGRPLGS